MNPGLFVETDSLSPRTFASKSARIGPRGPRSAAGRRQLKGRLTSTSQPAPWPG